jgi:hypothetical protein
MRVIIHIYMKCHRKTSCGAIFTKQKCHFISFTKSEIRKAEQVLSGGLLPVGAGRMWRMGEYGANTVYTCM